MARSVSTRAPIVAAAFADAEGALAAVRDLRARGMPSSRLDVLSPVPIPGADEALGPHPRTPVYAAALIAGLTGGIGAFALQDWVASVANPWIVGGRPMHSPLAWVPITFETLILSAALGAVAAFLAVTRLPEPWHPVLEIPGIGEASRDRFVVQVHGEMSPEQLAAVRDRLLALGALWIRGDAP